MEDSTPGKRGKKRKLENDFDTTNGSSREVLLAAGWFISNQKLFEKFVYNVDCAFDFVFCATVPLLEGDSEVQNCSSNLFSEAALLKFDYILCFAAGVLKLKSGWSSKIHFN